MMLTSGKTMGVSVNDVGDQTITEGGGRVKWVDFRAGQLNYVESER